MLEAALTRQNLQTALKRVKANKGAACPDAALLAHALERAFDVLGCGRAADAAGAVAQGRDAQADACACALLLAVVAAGVLAAFDVQVAADLGMHCGGGDGGTCECGVGPGLQVHRVARHHVGVALYGVVSVGVAPGGVGAGVQVGGAIGAAAGANYYEINSCLRPLDGRWRWIWF